MAGLAWAYTSAHLGTQPLKHRNPAVQPVLGAFIRGGGPRVSRSCRPRRPAAPANPAASGWRFLGANAQSRVQFWEKDGVRLDYYFTTGEDSNVACHTVPCDRCVFCCIHPCWLFAPDSGMEERQQVVGHPIYGWSLLWGANPGPPPSIPALHPNSHHLLAGTGEDLDGPPHPGQDADVPAGAVSG